MKDWIGRWFALLEEEGEYTTIDCGHRASPDAPLTWRSFPHSEHDGISTMLTVLGESKRLSDVTFPRFPMRPRPPFWTCALEYLRYLARLPLRPAPLNTPLPSRLPSPAGRPTAVGWHVFDTERTSQIEARAKQQGVHVNSLLLASLDRAVRSRLIDSPKPTIWMLPVFLHEVDFATLADQPRNRSSFVDVYLRPDDTAVSTEKTVRTLLLRGAAWGGWVGLNTFRLLGEWGLRLFLRFNPFLQRRTGAFTNLGRWEDRSRRYPDELWLGFPPVLRYQPIGAAAVTWNGRLEIGLWLHPFLATDSASAEAVVAAWRDALLAA